MATKPLAEAIPLSQAWREGRRVYIRCSYGSQLNTDLREIGAKWDRDALHPDATPTDRPGALWVGTGKAQQVIDLIQAAAAAQVAEDAAKAARIATVRAIMDAATANNWWVKIYANDHQIRDRIKDLSGVWDPADKRWAMPTAEAHAEIAALIADVRGREQAAKEADRAERKAAAQRTDEQNRALALTKSGRTPTGETAHVTRVSTEYLNRAQAEARAHELGHVIHLADGRRGVVVGVKVWFTSSDLASSVCWHPQTHDEAHWDWRYELAIVEPTEEELAADAADAATAAEIKEIRGLFDVLSHAEPTEAGQLGEWSDVAGPRIEKSGGSAATGSYWRDGSLILDESGGRVVYQHPGYYDDYQRSERASTDPDLVARVRAIIDGGTRRLDDGHLRVTA